MGRVFPAERERPCQAGYLQLPLGSIQGPYLMTEPPGVWAPAPLSGRTPDNDATLVLEVALVRLFGRIEGRNGF